MATPRYHVQIGKKRTTIVLAPALTELLALKLGKHPGTPEGHAAIRGWLQEEIDRDPGAVRYGRASQRLAHQVILSIASPSLLSKREQWQTAQSG